MDDKPTQQNGTPSATIIPFTSNPRESSSSPPETEDVFVARARVIVTDAFNQSMLANADQEVLTDEHTFRRRFGFTVNCARREKVLDLKRRADLTDREIRMLWWTSNLDLNGTQAKITASRIIQIWGYIQMAILCLLMLIGILKAVEATDRTVLQLIALVTAEGVMAAILIGVEYLYVRPYQIFRRSLSEQRAKPPIVT